MTLQPINRERLDKLATYLESLPEDYQHFEMSGYLFALDEEANEAEAHYAQHNGGVPSCGTAACAVGHGPAAGILMPECLITESPHVSGKFYVDWDDYSLLFTGEDCSNTPLWEWLFGGSWSYIDNHHRGAAARIRYVLAGREIPFGPYDLPAERHLELYKEFRK
ncbi:hypothetical protein KNJ79_05200 [Sphingopyxis indica]|uniref:hypothetical protein n=1 Tax=Sphingopyxis indica TaxID=436663 RepID=UPI0029393086|nr:hypothetical protein [Sphingopyxis indica]WOF44329.1 hypothetical protein KNJ79_05200 [Sphingopyxis indica]